ncbi:unnamed protein product [Acanthoscelides obtectus]|uniref:SCAN domain-containing protein 3 n=1 Tax=Acanthoscelides obtectus TaxID=200917 RepID=A0A9P0P5A8_ACAOB|nr:unnamed protein product [Acanthoscelides obtectus]CAK1632597.1 SCAN domain-containing protein 3 [Acanthoscelides obtectus]
MNQEIYEELLFARTLITDTKGESIFHVLNDYFIEKAIPLSNIISLATDGAPAIVGRYRGFISYLKQNVSGVLAIHCIIHRQHLVAKNLSVRLHESLHLVIDAVNRIRSNALNTRLFAQLCEENDEHFHQLLLHTEVCWLSKGLCLTRFFALFETILEFLDTKDKILKENLMKRKTDIAYLTVLFTKFNMVNLQLQGDSLNLIKTKSILSPFLARVKLMKQNIGRGEFSQFPNLSQASCQEDDVSTYVQHLNALYSDFESRFEDILTMVIPPWIINPYGDIEETIVIIQEELTELSTNEELKVQFKNGYQQFWLQNNIPVTYPVLWIITRKFLISFPSSNLVERGFSAVTNLLTKKRNRLDIICRGDLRLTLTKLTPNVDNLLLKHQVIPAQSENILFRHPGVKEVALVGKPDDRVGVSYCICTETERRTLKEVRRPVWSYYSFRENVLKKGEEIYTALLSHLHRGKGQKGEDQNASGIPGCLHLEFENPDNTSVQI